MLKSKNDNMLIKKECVAMLLAGGQGSRLYALTNSVAKPAVRYGGKYRIIDFPLSNCVNSNIDTVGVLTQYQPFVLNQYIGNGQAWDLDRLFGGVHILPPYQGKTRMDWYKGTANAIYQNIGFMKRYNPEYILILSGDHIYKMDYSKMIQYHKDHNAEATLAIINVPLNEASRFGILNTKENNQVYEFEEKPREPKCTNASMGIYIFNAELLYKYLEDDDCNPESKNDFGKNIIPKMLVDGVRIFAYPFHGYWKDVGTVSSLWDANMDVLGEEPNFNLCSSDWKIYSRNDPYPPQFAYKGSQIKNSLITAGCEIEGTVINSVISNNVHIGKDAVVRNSVLFDGVVVEDKAVVDYAIVDENVVIKQNATVGLEDEKKITVIGADVIVGKKATVSPGSMVEKDVE